MLPRASVTKALLAERVASDYSSDWFLRTQTLRKVLKLLPTVKSEVNSFENDIQTLEEHGSDTFCLKQTGILRTKVGYRNWGNRQSVHS